jgi:hypothetical protein
MAEDRLPALPRLAMPGDPPNVQRLDWGEEIVDIQDDEHKENPPLPRLHHMHLHYELDVMRPADAKRNDEYKKKPSAEDIAAAARTATKRVEEQHAAERYALSATTKLALSTPVIDRGNQFNKSEFSLMETMNNQKRLNILFKPGIEQSQTCYLYLSLCNVFKYKLLECSEKNELFLFDKQSVHGEDNKHLICNQIPTNIKAFAYILGYVRCLINKTICQILYIDLKLYNQIQDICGENQIIHICFTDKIFQLDNIGILTDEKDVYSTELKYTVRKFTRQIYETDKITGEPLKDIFVNNLKQIENILTKEIIIEYFLDKVKLLDPIKTLNSAIKRQYEMYIGFCVDYIEILNGLVIKKELRCKNGIYILI